MRESLTTSGESIPSLLHMILLSEGYENFKKLFNGSYNMRREKESGEGSGGGGKRKKKKKHKEGEKEGKEEEEVKE